MSNDFNMTIEGLEIKRHSKGDVIIKEGERSDQVLVLKSGAVRITTGDREICKINEVGTIFGEISALLDTEHSATVTAEEDCSFYLMRDFVDHIKSRPEHVLFVAKVLAGRLVHMNHNFLEIRAELEKMREGEPGVKQTGKLNSLLVRMDEFWGSSIF